MEVSKREPLVVEYVSVEDIRPYEKNAKTHDPGQVKKIASSIKKFGWRKPIVVDKDGVIICGHGAYFASKQLGLNTVPVVHATDLTEKEVKAYRLADNKVAESPWDFKLLTSELDELIGFDMGDFGFELVSDLDDAAVDSLFEDAEQKDKTPKTIKCPHCGELFEI